MKQVTVRLNDELHKEMKYLMLEIDKSINDYILELIKQDLEKRKEKNKKQPAVDTPHA